jgi:hypothetical protein
MRSAIGSHVVAACSLFVACGGPPAPRDAAAEPDAAMADAGLTDAGADAGPDAGRACDLDTRCPSGSYCELAERCGTSTPRGVCEPNDEPVCSTAVEPVCGCDNRTYQNACIAQRSGMDSLREGACRIGDCGPLAGGCEADEFCDVGAMCDAPDAHGTCRPRQDITLKCGHPIPGDEECGCDGVTYFGACWRLQQGVSLAHVGPCDCAGSGECVEGFFCDHGTACGGAGTCREVPLECDDGPSEPVCGCDGLTYPSECAARRARISLSHRGAC